MTTSFLSAKEKAIVGTGLSVAIGCQPCTRRNIQAARDAGACERSIRLAIQSGLESRARVAAIMAACANEQQPSAPDVDAEFRASKQYLVDLITAGAGYALNCPQEFRLGVAAAREHGANEKQLGAALAVAKVVDETASAEIEKERASLGFGVKGEAPAASACDCGCGNERANAEQTVSTCGCGETRADAAPAATCGCEASSAAERARKSGC